MCVCVYIFVWVFVCVYTYMQGECGVLSCVRLVSTPWTVAHQAPLFMEFSRQAYWSGLPFPTPGDLPDPGIKPASLASPALQTDSLPLSHQGSLVHFIDVLF